jgi:HlyD family type I secretion membrane fusion protein
MTDVLTTPHIETTARTGLADLMTTLTRVVSVALGVFVLWAVLIPLDEAVVANGTVISSAQNQVLQHPTGGRVTAIHVRDGQKVVKGGSILSLDPLVDQAELTKLKGRRAYLRAVRVRLDSEKARPAEDMANGKAATARMPGHGYFNLLPEPQKLAANSQTANDAGYEVPENAEIELYNEQHREFEKGRAALDAEVEAQVKKALGLRQRRDGLQERVPLLTRQVALLTQQLDSARKLVKGGHISQQQAWEIEARLIDRSSELVSVKSELASTTSGIAEVDSLVSQIKSRDARETSQKRTEVVAELDQISDQIRAAEQAIAQKIIAAPESGTIVRLAITTVGAVVKPGDVVGEIVPENTPLEVEARVHPKDIASIAVGQQAKVKLSALAHQNRDPLIGEVVTVAADSSLDERTQERYFSVRVRIADTPQNLPLLTSVSVGMTGDAYLLGKPRSFASYVFQPLFSSFGKAFGES